MKNIYEGLDRWHAQLHEEVVDPDREIVDAHHHLHEREGRVYRLEDLHRDTDSGHRITQTVFVDCKSHYRQEGPEALRPVGETEYVASLVEASRAAGGASASIAAIVSHADLKLGAAVEEVLDAHAAAGRGLFRGIRQVAAHDPHEELRWIGAQVPPGLYRDPGFLQGLRVLGAKGFSFDAWHFHHQMRDFISAVRAVPQTTFVLDHFSTLLGVGPYAGRRQEIVRSWREDMAELARLPNVYIKLGGTTMPANGFGWENREVPVTSDEYVAQLREVFLFTIDTFGPRRCMFESNFPVDKISVSYRVLWNAYKKMAAAYSEDEKAALFCGTARNVYRT